MKRENTRSSPSERGYALLFVFVLAAGIAIMLYREVPRVAFETQRDREQLLVDRGMQYRRSIQVFYRKFRRYPTKIEELESTNNLRFLRQRYKDPLTGKDEWRLIHIGPGGLLTDSLVQKPPEPGKSDKDKLADSGLGGTSTPNGNPADPQAGVNFATLRRPSDRTPGSPTGVPGSETDPNQLQNPGPQYPPQVQPGMPVIQPNTPVPTVGQPGQLQPGQVVPGQPVQIQPGVFQPGQVQPGQVQPGQIQQGQPGQGQPGQLPGFPPQPGQPTTPQEGQQSQQNPAVNMIMNRLTGPAPPSVSSAFNTQAPNSGTVGGGIAGVATKYEGEGIKRINERSKYKEWEFVYDFKNDRSTLQPGQQQQGQRGTGAGGPQPTGTPPPNPPPAKTQ